MEIRTIRTEGLGDSTHVLVHEGVAAVVDPQLDFDRFTRVVEETGAMPRFVLETHVHNDYLSGGRAMARALGAELVFPAGAAPVFRHRPAFHHEDLDAGPFLIRPLHTPGHTPEHLSFLVTDTSRADRPMGALTGDFIFVGDVGRPDLLEKAAKVEGTMEGAARTLYRSLQRMREQPDYLLIWPGHGAGSACGKGMSALPHSTLGYERMFNWAFNVEDEEEFVRTVLAGQPEPPKYFAEMKRLNREGPPILGGMPRPDRVAPERLGEVLDARHAVVDIRPAAEFARAHVPGSVNIPLSRSFSTWAGSLLPYDRDVFLVSDSDDARSVDSAARDLAMIGLDRVRGWFGAGTLETWTSHGGELAITDKLEPASVSALLRAREVQVVDVRTGAEWEAGHVDGARHLPLAELPDRWSELADGRPVVVHCQSGMRSAIAASFLSAAGLRDVSDLSGGFSAWQHAGLPVARERESERSTATG